jgi:hypothetical protein
MKPTPILHKIIVLLLACLLGGMGFIFAAVMAKGVVDELNLQDPWDLIVCFSMIITSTAAGVTAAYLLGYGLPKKSKDNNSSSID